MAGFIKPLVVTPLPDGKYWVTDRDLEYCVGTPNSSTRILVPSGFKTDFASVPRLLWPILPPIGKYTAAAVLHDWLYQHPQVFWVSQTESWHALDLNRQGCDAVFDEAMEVLEVSDWARRLMYRGVRLGGWMPWRKYRKEDQRGD